MADPARPAALRIARPYATEDEFIEGDLNLIGRAGLLLANAPAVPVGELIRFEVLLSTGVPVVRGEGHVVAHHPPGGPRPAGLEVRLTRTDAKSKTLLDRARARKGSTMSMVAPVPQGASVVVSPTSLAPMPATTTVNVPMMPTVPAVVAAARMPPPPTPSAVVPSPQRAADSGRQRPRVVEPPPNRDEMLERLRARYRERDPARAQGGAPPSKSS